MFQRLKGALDARIAEEQARQQAAQSSLNPPSRSDSRSRRLPQRADSPAKRSSRPPPRDRQDERFVEGPEPSAFEPELVVADDDSISRSSTPLPADKRSGDSAPRDASRETPLLTESREQAGKDGDGGQDLHSIELPTDVRVKLRRLEKLESRYHELLRSYRVAHARVQTIEPFENALRECTPLLSINDPSGLSEYLNQINLKGDMVLDELKRVSGERDSLRTKVTEAEDSAKRAWDEVSGLKRAAEDATTRSTEEKADRASGVGARPSSPQVADSAEHVESGSDAEAKSKTSETKVLPNAKDLHRPEQEGEEFFSFDEEISRLQQVVKDRQETISRLEHEVNGLKGDLAVTRESTQSMVESLEEATRELNILRDFKDRFEGESKKQQAMSEEAIASMQTKLEAAENLAKNKLPVTTDRESSIDDLNRRLEEAYEQIAQFRREVPEAKANAEKVKTSLQESEACIKLLQEEKVHASKRVDTLDKLVVTLRSQLAQTEDREQEARTILEKTLNPQKQGEASSTLTPTTAPTDEVPTASKKKNKKKKKGSNNEAAKSKLDETAKASKETVSEVPSDSLDTVRLQKLQDELEELRQTVKAKESTIESLQRKLKDQEDLQDEIETLRDDLINVGQENVSAKDRVKDLTDEKAKLQSRILELEEELSEMRSTHSDSRASQEEYKELVSQFDDVKAKSAALQSDLSAAQQLASSRFKDMNELKKIIERVQPELVSLRNEASKLKPLQENIEKKDAEVTALEGKQKSLCVELSNVKQTVSDRDVEIKALNQRLGQETSSRLRGEAIQAKGNQELERLKQERKEALDSLGQLSKDLAKSQGDLANARSRLEEVGQEMTQHQRERDVLREEMELRSAQYASAQSLMSSMRDQTNEMAMQMKEARDRCENLEEEVGDAHRLLSERSREAETMRRLLADVESRSDARTREMKERMEIAMEERDRAEDEASTTGRRKARELEELRNELREAERGLKRAEEDKEELEMAQRDWKRRREELEKQLERSSAETSEVRLAMSELRDVLDEAERQTRDLDTQKSELRRSVEETQRRLEKLQKSNKNMAEEIQTMRNMKSKRTDTPNPSSRSSIDSVPAGNSLASPPAAMRRGSGTPSETVNGTTVGPVDTVYLKNVLLQFLEQKDRKHQMQLIPVLGMLLHFDRKEEQKWMSAISSK